MANVLATVDQRTNLVGENRLELLLFRINSMQLFAINVFKVKEVVKLPPLNAMPGS
ncbi:MAG: chemotaxis protein CheW, partial [Shewanella sp.]